MFDPTSRYALLETASITMPDGSTTNYVRRRFLPEAGSMSLLGLVKTVQNDRMDAITARTLGDPLAFWRIADANDAMSPFDLSDEIGRTLRVPFPQ